MNVWRGVLAQVKAELLRSSQGVGGYRVIPNRIEIDLPADEFRPWQPVLASVTGEIGAALESWALRNNTLWYQASGPALEVRLEPVGDARIRCHFEV